MTSLFGYFAEDSAERQETLPRRCVRVLTMVATCWTLLGSGLGMYGISHTFSPVMTDKLRILQIGSLLIAMAIYSVILPIHYLLRSEEKKAASRAGLVKF